MTEKALTVGRLRELLAAFRLNAYYEAHDGIETDPAPDFASFLAMGEVMPLLDELSRLRSREGSKP